MPTLIYFIQANLFLILFFGFYYFLFKKETFHAVNRFFLLFGAVFALILPFFKSPFLKELPIYPVEAEHIATDYYFVTAAIVEKPLTHQITYLEVLEYCYFVGLGLSIIILLFRISKTIFWVKNNKNQSGTAFSFLGKVFIDKALAGQQFIKKHEEIHVRQLHFADLLFFEILKTVFWFNPVVYFYKKAIAIIHEFLADEVASAIAKDKAQYAQILLSKQFRAENATVFTQHFFNHSTLKSRIIMLSKNPSNKTAMLKYGFVAPLFFVMLLVSSFTIAKPENLENVVKEVEERVNATFKIKNNEGTLEELENIIAIQEDEHDTPEEIKPPNINFLPSLDADIQIMSPIEVKDSLPKNINQNIIYNDADENPEFPGGTSHMNLWLANKIKYPLEAKANKIEGRVYLKFVIEKDGSIGNIEVKKGIGYGCDEVAVKAVKSMPKWNPGIKNGEPVAVYYNMPVVFKWSKYVVDETMLVMELDADSKWKSFSILSPKKSKNKAPQFKLNNKKINPIVLIDNVIVENTKGIDLDMKANKFDSYKYLEAEKAIPKYGEKAKDGAVLIFSKKN